MRVAIIAPPWVSVPPTAYGGTEAVLDSLSRGLVDAGHEVLLFTTGDSTCPVPRGWELERALGIGRAGVASEMRHVVAAYSAAQDYDIVHDHTLMGGLYADRLPWLPVVTTNHGPFDRDLSALYQTVSNRAPVIAISHHQASTAVGIKLAGVIYHGVDCDRIPTGGGDGGYAMFLGRMSPDKGVREAVQAARDVGMPLLIAAKMHDRAEHDYFESEIAPLLSDEIQYVGEIGRPEKEELLGRAVCLINPIAWPEPFGMVMIEALASGTPVIAYPAGSVPEIITDGVTGFLANDHAGLVDCLRRIGTIDRTTCRREAELRFSSRRMVADHVLVYERIIEDHHEGVFGPLLRPEAGPQTTRGH